MNTEPRAFDAKDSEPYKKFNKTKAAVGIFATSVLLGVGGAQVLEAFDKPSATSAEQPIEAVTDETPVSVEQDTSEVSPEKVQLLNDIRKNILDVGTDGVTTYTIDITEDMPTLETAAIATAARESGELLTGENIGEIKKTAQSMIEERTENGKNRNYHIGDTFNLYHMDFDENGKGDFIVGESNR